MVVGIATPVRETELHLLVLDILDASGAGNPCRVSPLAQERKIGARNNHTSIHAASTNSTSAYSYIQLRITGGGR
jgi:hypothetical protein